MAESAKISLTDKHTLLQLRIAYPKALPRGLKQHPRFYYPRAKMNKIIVFALAAVLACFVASVASQSAVAAAQKVVLEQIASEWPALQTWPTKPWNSANIEQACSGGVNFVSTCNATGWITTASFIPTSGVSSRVPIPASVANMSALETLTLGSFFGASLDDIKLGN